jgi:hypothetical protein
MGTSGTLSVAFTAPSSDGGAAISNYKYSLDNGATWITRSPASISSPLVISGLTNGTSYQVKLLAVNSKGDGAASGAVTGTPVAAAAPASSPATLTVPATVLASTGTNLGSGSSYVILTLLIGFALVLVSYSRRSQKE